MALDRRNDPFEFDDRSLGGLEPFAHAEYLT